MSNPASDSPAAAVQASEPNLQLEPNADCDVNFCSDTETASESGNLIQKSAALSLTSRQLVLLILSVLTVTFLSVAVVTGILAAVTGCKRGSEAEQQGEPGTGEPGTRLSEDKNGSESRGEKNSNSDIQSGFEIDSENSTNNVPAAAASAPAIVSTYAAPPAKTDSEVKQLEVVDVQTDAIVAETVSPTVRIPTDRWNAIEQSPVCLQDLAIVAKELRRANRNTGPGIANKKKGNLNGGVFYLVGDSWFDNKEWVKRDELVDVAEGSGYENALVQSKDVESESESPNVPKVRPELSYWLTKELLTDSQNHDSDNNLGLRAALNIAVNGSTLDMWTEFESPEKRESMKSTCEEVDLPMRGRVLGGLSTDEIEISESSNSDLVEYSPLKIEPNVDIVALSLGSNDLWNGRTDLRSEVDSNLLTEMITAVTGLIAEAFMRGRMPEPLVLQSTLDKIFHEYRKHVFKKFKVLLRNLNVLSPGANPRLFLVLLPPWIRTGGFDVVPCDILEACYASCHKAYTEGVKEAVKEVLLNSNTGNDSDDLPPWFHIVSSLPAVNEGNYVQLLDAEDKVHPNLEGNKVIAKWLVGVAREKLGLGAGEESE